MKQANILVDNAGTARVADFGLMVMADLGTVLLSETAVSPQGTLPWMSPELLDSPPDSDGRPTRESDYYALGMVIYEVSWLRPLVTRVPYLPIPGSDWSPTIPPSGRLL